jgi:hypothetical protein
MQSRLERRMPGVARQVQNSVANVLQEQTGWDFVQMGRMEGAADTFAALRLTGGRVRFFTSRADQGSEARTAPNANLAAMGDAVVLAQSGHRSRRLRFQPRNSDISVSLLSFLTYYGCRTAIFAPLEVVRKLLDPSYGG